MTLRRNLAWTAFGQVAFFVIQFGGTVVLARILTPYEMGVYAIAAALVGVLMLLQAFGLSNFIIREPTLQKGHIATAFTMNALISLALAAIIFGLGMNAHVWFDDTGVAKVLKALAIIPLIGIFQLVPYAQLERRGLFNLLVRVNMTRQLLATGCTVASALAGYSYLSLPFGQICGGIAGAILVNLLGRQHVQFSLSVREWRRILTFGLQMAAISGVSALAGRTSEILLGRILGLQALGLFMRASTLFTLFWDNLHLILGRVMFVDLAARRRNGESLRGTYLIVAEVMTASLWPTFLGLAILSQPLFLLIYGERWLPAALPFAILAISAVVQVSVTLTWELFTVSGETSRQVKIEAFRAVAGVALFSAGCIFGIVGAATARVIDSIVSMAIYRPHVERMTNTALADLMPIYGRSALLSLAAVAPAGLLMLAQRGSPLVSLWLVGSSILAGVVLWSLGLILLKHPLYAEGRRLANRLRARGA